MNDNRKAWTNEEDQVILNIVQIVGCKNWPLVSKIMKEKYHLQGRTGKQCRERWHNHLAPQLNKMPWTSEEEQLLFFCHRKYGNKWIQISKYFEGRTDNSIKNHFYSTIRRSMRRICKILGNKNSTSRLRNIRPSVLSEIFQFSKTKSRKQQNFNKKLGKYDESEQNEIEACLLEFANTKPSKNKDHLQKNKAQLQLLVQKLIILNEQYINSKNVTKIQKSKGRNQSAKRSRILSQDSQNDCENQKSTQQIFLSQTFKKTVEKSCYFENQESYFQMDLNNEQVQKRVEENSNFYLSKQNSQYYSYKKHDQNELYQSQNFICFENHTSIYEKKRQRQMLNEQLESFSSLENNCLFIKKMPIHQILFQKSFNDEILKQVQHLDQPDHDLMNDYDFERISSNISININVANYLQFSQQPLQDIGHYLF